MRIKLVSDGQIEFGILFYNGFLFLIKLNFFAKNIVITVIYLCMFSPKLIYVCMLFSNLL